MAAASTAAVRPQGCPRLQQRRRVPRPRPGNTCGGAGTAAAAPAPACARAGVAATGTPTFEESHGARGGCQGSATPVRRVAVPQLGVTVPHRRHPRRATSAVAAAAAPAPPAGEAVRHPSTHANGTLVHGTTAGVAQRPRPHGPVTASTPARYAATAADVPCGLPQAGVEQGWVLLQRWRLASQHKPSGRTRARARATVRWDGQHNHICGPQVRGKRGGTTPSTTTTTTTSTAAVPLPLPCCPRAEDSRGHP